jgi:hypothetical protein
MHWRNHGDSLVTDSFVTDSFVTDSFVTDGMMTTQPRIELKEK